jgi:hypothetical protein
MAWSINLYLSPFIVGPAGSRWLESGYVPSGIEETGGAMQEDPLQ